MPVIGAHVSAAVSLERSFKKALEIGARTTQIFISPPQQWFQNKHDNDEILTYKSISNQTGIIYNYIHATYLINLGTQNSEHLQNSIDWLIYALNIASKMGVRGVVVHTGSHKGLGMNTVLDQVCHSITAIMKKHRERSADENLPYLILENTAGAGGTIGKTFKELGMILKQVNDPNLKVCLDTQHAFAAGYDFKTSLGLTDVLQEFEEEIGIDNLEVIHCNDSKTGYKSLRDRHENIGEGFIGKEAFSLMLNHPKLSHLPFILEVPGFSGNGPDKENVEILQSLISKT